MQTYAILVVLAAFGAAQAVRLRPVKNGLSATSPPRPSLVELPELRLVKAPLKARGSAMKAPAHGSDANSSEVDVMIGTGGHGHTFPGATTPFGMVLATPWAHEGDPWDSQAGFHRPDESRKRNTLDFYGMAHTALSGAGSGEMGELRLLPLAEEGRARSFLTVDSVKGSPGYFSGSAGHGSCQVHMEATATPRGALHRFGFPQSDDCRGRAVKLVLKESPRNFWGFRLGPHKLKAVGKRRLEGCSASQVSGMGGADSYMCFVVTFDADFKLPSDSEGDNLDSDVLLRFPEDTSSLVARVAVSRLDLEHAKVTLDRELGERSFEEILAAAQGLWHSALSVAQVDMEPQSRLRQFYTSLYHSMLFPSLLSEEDGAYRLQRSTGKSSGVDFTLYNVDHALPAQRAEPGQKIYSTFSLWDTHRTTHPLMNLLQPKVSTDFGASLVKMSEVWGFLPSWQLVQSPIDMMEGDGGSIVLGTLARDGLLDASTAFQAMKRSRTSRLHSEAAGTDGANFHGGISSKLEESRADQCTARVAKMIGRKDEVQTFEQRADTVFESWDDRKKVFKPFYSSYVDVNEICFAHAYAEGTPLQYSWAAEWHLEKLTALHGGRDAITCGLDYFFHEAPVARGHQPDVSGNMHGFAMGNEPDFHAPYLYSLLGRPAKTQEVVDKLVKDMFTDKPDGLPGNDDLGAVSAWLVFSMLGFYPADVCGEGVALGRPFVNSATLAVQGGTLKIQVHGQGEEKMYVEKLTWNGKELDAGRQPSGGAAFTIPYEELNQGGELSFYMTDVAPTDGLRCASKSESSQSLHRFDFLESSPSLDRFDMDY